MCVGHLQRVLAASFPDVITKAGENTGHCFGVEVHGMGPACLRSRHENCCYKQWVSITSVCICVMETMQAISW